MQERNTEYPVVSYALQRVVYLNEPTGVFANMHVVGMGLFRAEESLWQNIFDSFTWDPATGVALKFDGDERVFRARYTKKPRRARKASLPKLSAQLRYLQSVMDELLSLPPEEVNEDWDSSPLEKALRKRVKGLSLEKAESQLDADSQVLKQWMSEDPHARLAGEFVAAFMHAFQFALGESEEEQ